MEVLSTKTSNTKHSSNDKNLLLVVSRELHYHHEQEHRIGDESVNGKHREHNSTKISFLKAWKRTNSTRSNQDCVALAIIN